MPGKQRYTTLKEINVALNYMSPTIEKLEKAILGKDGLITNMVIQQTALEEHLKEYKESKDRKLIIKDKLFVGSVLSIIGSIVVLLRSCTPI